MRTISDQTESTTMEEMRLGRDSYKTETRKPSLPARLLPSLMLYGKILRIVRKASKKARQGRYDTREWCASSMETLRALEHVGVRIEIEGLDHFRALTGPCVFIGNHMSMLETFVLPVIIAPLKDTTFVVKQSLVDYPVFKYVMRTRNPVTVGRSNPRDDLKAVLEGGAERLKAGMSIVIFPQTTRMPLFDPEQFNTIGIKLAKKADVPAVPFALKTDAWSNGRYLKDFGRINPSLTVHFAFGEPLTIKDRGALEHQRIIDFITAKLKEWGGNVHSGTT
jgi:1-acyl-sn-glycerol-3-phosphate acyltransferase